ncbi:MAG: fused MFS/spermidine synthase [Acidimicrobiia bacterium]|nr:fused MFS/spermidine synthase [Acidimicrobiia bacterium]
MRTVPVPSATLGRADRSLAVVLFVVSGFAALVYQVLWVREVGLLVGSTAQAAALTIAVFFSGIALGSWWWGRRVRRATRPLLWFGLVELAVAASALALFGLVPLYDLVAPPLDAPASARLVAQGVVAAVTLLPASFFMGGTLPLMTEHLVRVREHLGRRASMLYAVNTAGSAAGALAAGFVLPLVLGFRSAYLLAVALDAAVGTVAVVRGRTALRAVADVRSERVGADEPALLERAAAPLATAGSTFALLGWGVVWVVAAVSGFTTLAAEVVWTRLFAQVLHNSVSTYALVLATFLVALAVGAALARWLGSRGGLDTTRVLVALLVACGLAVAVSPWLFDRLTNGVSYVGGDLGWVAYVLSVGLLAATCIGLPAVVLGMVLPWCIRVVQDAAGSPGARVGRLVAVNTVGAIAGSLVAGFVLLPMVGAARALLLVAAAYPVTALVVVWRAWPERAGLRVSWSVATAAAVVLLAIVPAAPLAEQGVVRTGETLEWLQEGPQANVAVLSDQRDDWRIRVNSTYTLGSTAGLDSERNQTVIPLLGHPDPQRVFYLGMGTGITAGAALSFPVERVVVCELIADVVEASAAFFGRWTNGLFDDGRAQVLAEDGRACLRRSSEEFDLVISDLFVPWEAGTGNLYTVELYQLGRERLASGGMFVQWIPLFQLSDRELGSIAASMDAVFDEVVLWRGDLFDARSIVALVGHRDPAPLDPAVLVANARQAPGGQELSAAELEAMALRLYAGNVSASGIYADRPLNTDDLPFVEYQAPRTHREVRAGNATFVVGADRERLYGELAERLPPDDDPYLSRLDEEQLGWVEAGRVHSQYRWLTSRGQRIAAAPLRRQFDELSLPSARSQLSPAQVLLE